MNRDDVRKLIGGYATGTLTEAEREMLFAAALEDQELFDELAGEQGFKELLDAPGVRARLLTAVAPVPAKRRQSWWAWGAIGAAAVAGLTLFFATLSTPPVPLQVATVKQEPAPPAVEVDALKQPAAAPPSGALRRKESPATQQKPEASGRTAPVQSTVSEERKLADQVAAPSPPPPPLPVAAPQPMAPVARKEEAPDQVANAQQRQPAQLAFAAPAAPAQAPVRGTLTGTVSDPTGAVIASAAIEARNLETGARFQGVSTATGNYTIGQLPAGAYEVSATVRGFKKYVQQDLAVQASQTLRIDIPLEVGSSAESVTVAADTALLKTETGQVSQAVTAGQSQQLPLAAAGQGGGGKSGAAAKGKGGGGVIVRGQPTNTAALRANGVAVVPFSFTYQRTADSLRIMPLAQGFLTVTAAGQALFPQNAVLTGSNVIVPLTAGTGDVTIVFAASAGSPAVQAVRRDVATGTVTDPNPSANSRLAIIVPALP